VNRSNEGGLNQVVTSGLICSSEKYFADRFEWLRLETATLGPLSARSRALSGNRRHLAGDFVGQALSFRPAKRV
jgi:hypothetical protein